jgi:hypothetical protein
MPRGGKRKGAGIKKGFKYQKTLEKEATGAIVREMVSAEVRAMTEAQIAEAKGIKFLVVRDKKTGKFLRVTDARTKLGDREEIIEVWEKDPSTQAFTDLMNRTIGKPVEAVDLATSGKIEISWIGD